jgi:hypothetical protein
MDTRQTEELPVFLHYEDESHRGYVTTLRIYFPVDIFKSGPEELERAADEFRAQLLRALEKFYYSKGGSENKW